MAHRFTIGVEEEFQIIDPDTLELRSHVVQLLSAAASRGLGDQVKQEMHQSIVETGTKICENVSELRLEMHRTRSELVSAAESTGLQVAAAGTHPFPDGSIKSFRPASVTRISSKKWAQLARSLLIFGMHIHVAMPDKQTTIDIMNMVPLFRASPPGAFHQFSFLDGQEHGPEIFSHHGVSPVSAHRNSGTVRFLERVRRLRQAADPAELHR